jgi:hypothetical protein
MTKESDHPRLLARFFAAKFRVREVLNLAIARLGPGDCLRTPGDDAAEVTVLNEIAEKVPAHARTEILNAVAVLRDRSER